MVTAGVLYQPKSFYLGGLLYSSVTCFFIGCLTLNCMLWLSKAHDKYGGTYSDLCGRAMQNKLGLYFLDFIILVSQFGPAFVNFGFILELLIRSLSIFSIEINPYMLMLLVSLLLIPICLIKSIKDQSWAHITADSIIISSVFIIGIFSSVDSSPGSVTIIVPQYIVYTLGTLIYAFEGIPLILPIKEEMQDPSKFKTVITCTISTITLIFLWFSIVNDFAYGSSLEDMVILNLPSTTWVALLLMAYCLAVILTLPLVLNPVFTISEKYFNIQGKKIYLNRLCFVITVILIGTAAREYLGICVSIIGGLLSAPLAFIFPAVIHLKLNAETHRDRVVSWVTIVAGVLLAFASTFSGIYLSVG